MERERKEEQLGMQAAEYMVILRKEDVGGGPGIYTGTREADRG